ncbi:MAG TPA: hypothetical protein VH816_01580 [Gaiellaceae bacterium]|jgi:hypothetical protein
MSLTRRDAVASVLAALGVVVYAGNAQGTWYLGSNRWAIATLFAIGIAGCTLGRMEAKQRTWAVVLATLGVAALAIAVAGLVTGSHALLSALLVVQLALWLGATLRHATVPPAAHPAGT